MRKRAGGPRCLDPAKGSKNILSAMQTFLKYVLYHSYDLHCFRHKLIMSWKGKTVNFICGDKPKQIIQKGFQTIKECNKVASYKINIQKSTAYKYMQIYKLHNQLKDIMRENIYIYNRIRNCQHLRINMWNFHK